MRQAKKKDPAGAGSLVQLITQRSYLDDIISSGSLRSVHNLETHPGTFFKGLETFRFDGGVMDEYILSSILLDKAKSFRVIKPLNCSFCHATTPFVLSPSLEPYDVSQPSEVGFQLALSGVHVCSVSTLVH